jgi:RNA polymerase sigma-70 factor (ECF subfamily)
MMNLSDEDVVRRVQHGEKALFEVLMRRYNQRIYRVVRAILRDDAETEDVMQQAYLNAYRHLGQFAERAKFSTWLTKIAVYEALHRVKKRLPMASLDEADAEGQTGMDTLTSNERDPEQALLAKEATGLLEGAVTALSDDFRQVFMLREVEGLSTLETAECLGINEETVKTRLHRARRQMRRHLSTQVETAAGSAFQLHARRCDRVVAKVLETIGAEAAPISSTGTRS